jgi:5-methylcytosine-specific restriction endonuclease McrA
VQKHTRIYLDHFGYGQDSWIPCEVCGSRAVDIHHIERRGMGGSRHADYIENLMGLCRKCHVEYGDKKPHLQWLKDKHRAFLLGPKGL